MRVESEAIVVAARPHGEHGAVVRALTPDEGLLAGYVRGGRSSRFRALLLPGNIVRTVFHARVESQLAALTVELVHSRAALLGEPLAALALAWSTGLVAAALPEGQRYPKIHAALDGFLAALEAAPSARGWAPALTGYEAVLLAELGYGGPSEGDVIGALRGNGCRLAEHVLRDHRTGVLDARERLVARLLASIA